MSANGSVGQLAAGGTDVVNGQIIAGPWRALYLPPAITGTTVRGVGGDMSLPTLPYPTAAQTGSSTSAGSVFNPTALVALVLIAAVCILLMRQIHWS